MCNLAKKGKKKKKTLEYQHPIASHVPVAELRALKDGLLLAIDLEILNLEIEMDSLVAVDLINSSITSNAFLSTIVADCRYLIERFEFWSLKHTFREANGCADLLAKSGLPSNLI